MFPMPAVPHPPVTVPAPSATPNTDHAATTDPALNTEAASNPAAIPSANPEPNAAPDLSTAPAQADKNSASSPSTSDATARDLQVNFYYFIDETYSKLVLVFVLANSYF